jgi:DNA-binding NtrC family response regulator
MMCAPLLVDDEEQLANLGRMILKHCGYEAVCHTSSIEALEAFREAPHRFDLVITDQTMPHMTGEELVRELRDIRPDVPIILCTGFSHTMTEETAQELGINAFLIKPLLLHDLVRAIRRVLEQDG